MTIDGRSKGFYRERTPFTRVPGEGPLTAAREIWAQVISVPEPGLAVAGMGKRDAPSGEGLPEPREVRRSGGRAEPITEVRVTGSRRWSSPGAVGDAGRG